MKEMKKMRTEPERVEGTLISHEISKEEIKQKDYILVQFDEGPMTLFIAYKDKMICVSPPAGMGQFLVEALSTGNMGFPLAQEDKIIKMWLVGRAENEDEIWAMFNYLDQKRGGHLGEIGYEDGKEDLFGDKIDDE